MKVIGVIPARFGSVRFPGKILTPILGKPLIQWVLEGASQSKKLNQLLVATDDDRILNVVKQLGFEAVLTHPDLPSGTDRIWAATSSRDADVLVNIQGDEPLITGKIIDQLVGVFKPSAQESFLNEIQPDMATLGHPISDEELESPNAVKVVLNQNSEALYFSRFPIPYSRHQRHAVGSEEGCLKHIGIYAYTKKFLNQFCEASPALIEKAESLEQLRALHLGARIHVGKVDQGLKGVDAPEDVAVVESILRRMYG